ncbi:DUF305 domain-containing protein [Rhodococcus sp. NPDC060090]|uniref:DUF305 domain-containing protein n=1 Tax=Rhodococcus sp. NPDC060090 TaxID=3347056 RepID=UPI0036536D26
MSNITIRVLALAALSLLLLGAGATLRPLAGLPEEYPGSAASVAVLSDVEVGFVQDMAAHHQQALQMTVRLPPGLDPAVAALADRIDAAQRLELGTLLGWLTLTGSPPINPDPMWWHSPTHAPGANLQGDADHHGTGTRMPGMATPAELDALSAAHGRDAEILFLQLMTRHHDGGVAMARAADLLLDDGPVKRIARAMLQEQSKESGLMTLMLAERDAVPAG